MEASRIPTFRDDRAPSCWRRQDGTCWWRSIDDDPGEADGDSGAWDATFLIRVGAGYNIEIGERYSFSPSIAFDFIGREQAFVYGAEFSIKF